MPSTEGDHGSALSRARVERRPAGRRGFAAARDHRCSGHRPDPSPPRSHGWARGRVRSCGFCRIMSPRARPRTARTSRPPGWAIGTTASLEEGLPDRGQPPNGLEVRGRGTPLLGAPRGDCSPRRLRPNLAPLRAPPVAMITLSPCPERRGERGTPPSPGAKAGRCCALARRRQREGRATPHLREEARCSPTRGTFHLEAVRERTAAAPGQQS